MANDERIKHVDEGAVEKPDAEGQLALSRRDFLSGLRKWSAAVIGVAVVGGLMAPAETNAGWVNGRGGWINGGGGGGSWVNRGGSWINGHGGGGAGWVNRSGGGGGSWVNRRGW